MADETTPDTSLDNAPQLVNVGRYAILDEHELPETASHPKIVVNAQRLKRIANNANKRVTDTGDMVPLVIGHTDDDKPETKQPPLVGFASNFDVQPLFDTGREAIWADFYIYDTKIDIARDYPRRSVELWASRDEIDPISLLGPTTPERDLGLMQFSRKDEFSYHYSLNTETAKMAEEKDKPASDEKKEAKVEEKETPKEDSKPQSGLDQIVAAVMESAPMKQMSAVLEKLMTLVDALENEPDGDEQPQPQTQEKPPASEAAKFNEPPPVKFDSSSASGSNTNIPTMVNDKEQYSRKDEADEVVKLRRQVEKLEKDAQETALRYRKDNATKLLEKLELEGFIVDKDEEFKLMEHMEEKSQAYHADRIRKYWRIKEKPSPVDASIELNDAVKYSRTPDGTKGPQSFADVKAFAEKARKQGLTYEEALQKEYGTK